MSAKRGVQLLELGPQHLVCEGARDARHDRGAPLAAVAIRLDAVPPEQCNEERLRPAVRQRETVLDRAFRLLELLEPPPDAIARVLRRGPRSPALVARAKSASIFRSFAMSRSSSSSCIWTWSSLVRLHTVRRWPLRCDRARHCHDSRQPKPPAFPSENPKASATKHQALTNDGGLVGGDPGRRGSAGTEKTRVAGFARGITQRPRGARMAPTARRARQPPSSNGCRLTGSRKRPRSARRARGRLRRRGRSSGSRCTASPAGGRATA